MTAVPDLAAERVLDNPVWFSLITTHQHLTQGAGSARRFAPDVSPFCALTDPRDPQAWSDLGEVVGPGGTALVPTLTGPLPDGVTVVTSLPGVQLVATAGLRDALPPRGGVEPTVVDLGEADVPDMLDLTARTRPGPFTERTHLLGRYVGIRDVDGRLLAMAGERLQPPGFTEISAVCTDPAARGRGLAGHLVRHLGAGIRAQDRTPFLHALATNTAAIRLYEALGFRLRRTVDFPTVHLPS